MGLCTVIKIICISVSHHTNSLLAWQQSLWLTKKVVVTCHKRLLNLPLARQQISIAILQQQRFIYTGTHRAQLMSFDRGSGVLVQRFSCPHFNSDSSWRNNEISTTNCLSSTATCARRQQSLVLFTNHVARLCSIAYWLRKSKSRNRRQQPLGCVTPLAFHTIRTTV